MISRKSGNQNQFCCREEKNQNKREVPLFDKMSELS